MAKILVIDDDFMLRKTITRILQSVGYDVVLAADGVRGMEAFHKEQVDLVITDIIMPDQEGIQTIAEIRREQPMMKIIAISGGGRIGNVDFLSMARSLGANDVVAKPFMPQDLLDRVSSCLADA